ncbi:RNA 3'-terminal phosphate cyclase [Dissulfurimicrobium hydrothermale]|uniref:RNA 3'-terminal phosphate cyclase n=1 Tax=Dissulfurimicrobium hydrothermale TaxID=1750598 RepID=UPI001EDA84D7|nr:RNA 3'-terminal phosphate cyclase [Dissulfurimicrobium hydrothermale]UKL13237.1 RNA 3'-phosphate cyclase [Dissulfurimicrobium hydrothermale]
MVEIDGSRGEGGGQILRTSLGLSCLFAKPFHMVNIRKNRRRPGLMPQHLASVKAAQAVANAWVEGADIGSVELKFRPDSIGSGHFFFDVGTAGSTSLVLQTILPALVLHTDAISTVTIAGGTHVPSSPCFHYLAMVFAPLLKTMGAAIESDIEAYGFYPRGCGKITCRIHGTEDIRPLDLMTSSGLEAVSILSGVCNLPVSIAQRQARAAEREIEALVDEIGIVPIELIDARRHGPGKGTFLFLNSRRGGVAAGFTAFGAPGKKAEDVGREAARAFLKYFAANAALDPYITDQIVLYAAICKKRSVFTTSEITSHMLTNLWVIEQFIPIRYQVDGDIG